MLNVNFGLVTYQNFHHGFFSIIFLSLALLFLEVALEAALASEPVTLSFQAPF